jgi:hypothetical protein
MMAWETQVQHCWQQHPAGYWQQHSVPTVGSANAATADDLHHAAGLLLPPRQKASAGINAAPIRT